MTYKTQEIKTAFHNIIQFVLETIDINTKTDTLTFKGAF